MIGKKSRLLSWRMMIAVALFSVILSPSHLTLYSAPNIWSAPVLVSPANGITATVVNYAPAAVPLFEWEAVSGATRYRIQIDDDSCAFSNPIRYNVLTPNTKYIPWTNGAFADGSNWCWRVRVEQPTPVGEWSEARSFTKDWGATANAPTLLSPTAGATVEFFESPIFSWTPVTGAAEYVLKIDNDYGCSSPLYQYTTPTTHYNPSSRFPNGDYYWCVTPRNANNHDGEMSESRFMTVQYSQAPQLLEPANASEPVYTPAFRWTAVKGAVAYRLYYSTDSTFNAGVTKITIKQTGYTLPSSLPNDQTYYWRVSAIYGSNWEGPFSNVWSFTKRWYHQPVLLTPRNNELVNVSLFTWTPVRETRKYKVQTSFDPGFATIHWTVETANTFLWRDHWTGAEWGETMYWRVIPYDYNNNEGKSSEIKSFRPTLVTALPENFWPRYFYDPPFIVGGHYASPYDIPISFDYTVDTPTFYWSKTFVPGADPREEADHYRLEVDTDPNFGSPDWVVLTENLSATPTDGNPFTPTLTAGTDYYWRVTPYSATGALLTSGAGNEPWMTQIDLSRLVTPTATNSPTLQLPVHGEKAMDTLPSFEWLPQQGAVRYEFEISDDAAFGSTTYVTRTTYTHHTPVVRVPIGTYFWRVRGLDGSDNTVGQWSEGRRIIVARQTRWLGVGGYHLGTLPGKYSTLLATDINDGLGATELISLCTAQDKDYWYIGFHVDDTPGTTWYGLYLDGDQTEGSGASFSPTSPALTTTTYYQPEYAIYFTGVAPSQVDLYLWDATVLAWDPQIKDLLDPVQVGGAFYYSSTLNYVELQIPKTAIGDRGEKPFSLSVALFSATSNTAATAADTVPDNGNATSVLTEFKTIGDRVSLDVPSGDLPGAYAELPYTPYMYAETPNTDYLGGYIVEVSRDPLFTSVLLSLQSRCDGCELFPDIVQYVFSPWNILEDNTLYWRYSIRHKFDNVLYNAPPSEPHLFTKDGPVPSNLRTEGDYSTPRFVWDAVEGAANYQFELATNPDFSPIRHWTDVNHESYTPPDAYEPGTYYWRVRAENSHRLLYASEWSAVSTLNITLPFVSLVAPVMGNVVHSNPTFEWDPVVIPGSESVYGWSAPRYHLQVASSPDGFSPAFEDIVLDTPSWTSWRSYPDDTYYWRVAVRDANNRDGPFSGVYTFTKQSPIVTLVEPITGTLSADPYPTFIWEPVDGAARYRIEIAQNPQFSPLIDSALTENVAFTPLKAYATAQYYWRVAMVDRYNNYGPWTDSILLIDPLPYHVYLPLAVKNY